MIRLETVNPDNWRLRLKVSDAQKSFVADSETDKRRDRESHAVLTVL